MRRLAPAALLLALVCAGPVLATPHLHDSGEIQRSSEGIDAAAAASAPEAPVVLAQGRAATLPTGNPTLAAEFERAKQALEDAEYRMSEADASYSRMRRSRRPRGAAKQEILQERADAHEAHAEAKAEYDALKRRAGVR